MKCPRVAFFTGAGASAHFGYPLTSQILPKIQLRLRKGELFDEVGTTRPRERRDREELAEFLCSLDRPKSTSANRARPRLLITELLSLVDESIRSGTILTAAFSVTRLRGIRVLLDRAILEVVEDLDEKRKRDLVHLTRWFWRIQESGRLSLISTNYDNCLESAIYDRVDRTDKDFDPEDPSVDAAWIGRHVDFGTPFRNPEDSKVIYPPASARVAVYKLHGSFSWLRCPLCDHTYINPYAADQLAYYPFMDVGDWNECVCGHLPLEMLMVSPSLVRDVRDTALLSVWRAAFEDLRTAHAWVIVGYSLPVEDLAIRSLLLRAYRARPRRPAVTVIQLNADSKPQYERLFPGCDFRVGGVGRFIDRIRSGKEDILR
jgi:NAD-dependent SIR2 family protein deacetylase